MKTIIFSVILFVCICPHLISEEYYGVVNKLIPMEKRVIRNGSRMEKKIAITIDDGWVDDEPLLDLLTAHGIRCTVFIPGKVAEERVGFVKKLDELGFEVCNHTYSHLVLTPLNDEEVIQDIRMGQEKLTEITGKIYPYFRPSGGLYDERVGNLIAAEGYYIILWDNDVMGYKEEQTLEDQLDYLRSHTENGNIILSHFGSKLRTRRVLEIFIPEMLAKGYEFVTVTDLIRSIEVKGRLAAGP